MYRRHTFGLAIMVSLAATATASGQESDSTLDRGRVVRLHTASELIEARLARPLPMAGGTVQFCAWNPSPCGVGAANRSIPLNDVIHIDVRRSYSGRGALVGGVAGVVVGYAMGRGFDGNECATSCGASGTLAVLGGVVFAGFGAWIGSAFTQWVQFR